MAATTFGAPQVRNRRITGARMKLRRAAIANGSTIDPATYRKSMIIAAIISPCATSARPLVLMNRIGTEGPLWSRGHGAMTMQPTPTANFGSRVGAQIATDSKSPTLQVFAYDHFDARYWWLFAVGEQTGVDVGQAQD